MDCERVGLNNIADLYVMDKLEPLARAEFEIHFIGCEKCADLVAETQELRKSLRAAAPEFERVRSSAIAPRGAGSWQRAALVTAAVIVVALLPTFALWRDNVRLRQQVSEVRVEDTLPDPQPDRQADTNENQSPASPPSGSRREAFPASPQINTPIFVLTGVRDAASAETNEITLDASEWFVLSLELEDRQFEQYRATILTADRRPFWKSGSLRADRHDAITIGFSSRFFRAGNYLVVLEGRSNEENFAHVATYSFRAARKKK